MCTIDKKCPSILKSLCVVENEQSGVPYSCALNKTDIEDNSNKSCIIQLLNRVDSTYFIYIRSGRLGSTGNESVECYIKKDDAISSFEQHFLTRTGIKWCNRDKDLDTPDGKYQYIIMKYNEKEKEKEKEKEQKEQVLQKNIEKLMNILFNENLQTNVMSQYNIDVTKLPLGELSLEQIKKAYDILKDLLEVIEKGDSDAIKKLSSRFYTTIPTVGGKTQLVALDTNDKIQEKSALLSDLENLCSIVKNKDSSLYTKYLSLNCNISLVSDPTKLSIIKRYVENRGPTHTIQLNIKSVYDLSKVTENKLYSKWETLHNKQLLWHGTSLANVAGILTNSLCINPIGVSTTGKMFGNGLYFANTSTKSAGYMRTIYGYNSAMFLCEVALGNMHELTEPTLSTFCGKDLPPGKHSTKGQGVNGPDPLSHVLMEDDVIVPIGDIVKRPNINSLLLYDEFIVYDPSQVKLRYLVIFE